MKTSKSDKICWLYFKRQELDLFLEKDKESIEYKN